MVQKPDSQLAEGQVALFPPPAPQENVSAILLNVVFVECWSDLVCFIALLSRKFPAMTLETWFKETWLIKETKILHSICREERKTVLEVTVHDRNKTPSITHPAFTRSGIKRRSQRGRRRRGFLRKQNICYKKKLWFTRLEKEQRETFEFGLLTRQVQCSSVVLDPLSVNLTAIEDRT